MRFSEWLGRAIVTVCISGVAVSQGVVNSGFEEYDDEGGLTAWKVFPEPDGEEGFRVFGVSGDVLEGEYCGQLGWYSDSSPRSEGWIYQDVPAGAFRDRRVCFRASLCMRAAGMDGEQMRLMLQIWTGDRWLLFDDGMRDRPLVPGKRIPKQDDDWTLHDAPWEEHALFADIPDEAEWVRIGVALDGPGDLWVDQVSLEAVGDAGVGLESPRELEGRALDNVHAFTKLFGYVRHFHPSDQASEADWTALAVDGVRAVESAEDSAELARRLREFFADIAPTVDVAPLGGLGEPHAALQPPGGRGLLFVRWWKHRGYGQTGGGGIYKSDRRRGRLRDGVLPEDAPNPAETFRAELPGGVECSVPLGLYQYRGKTLPVSEGIQADPSRLPRTASDRSTRLAAVIHTWNVLQHFYPYFDVVEVDWEEALRDALQAAAEDTDEVDLARTLRRLLAQMRDGHGWIARYGDPSVAAPIHWDWVEGALLVTHTAEIGAASVVAGERVLEIDGVATEVALAEKELETEGSTDARRRLKALDRLKLGRAGDPLRLELEGLDGERRTVRIDRFSAPRSEPDRPEEFTELEPGIFYVDLDRVSWDRWEARLAELVDARAIIFDMRGYPQQPIPWSHFIEEPLDSPTWEIPTPSRPDREELTFHSHSWKLPPKEPRFTAKVAVLTGPGAQSAAETCLSFFEIYELGEIFGRPTSGTNGNVNHFHIPCGIKVTWTGMRTLKQDGSQHHGVGVLPTVLVERTRQGVIDGRDEVLEAALESFR